MPQLSDIARKAHVSVATVSLALRNLPQIPIATRERVQAIARELGYRPNPLVSAYQANVRGGGQRSYRGTIAWIDDSPPDLAFNQNSAYLEMQQGARDQATAQGFTLDVITVPDIDPNDDAGNHSRMERILGARGIMGMIFPQLWWARLLTYEWNSVAVAAFGGNAGYVEQYDPISFSSLRYSHVLSDVYHDTRLALAHLRDLGYRRIALITSRYQEIGASYRYSAAHHAFSIQCKDVPRIDSWIETQTLTSRPPPKFQAWLRATRPDAVLTTLAYAREWLSACGLEAPQDIGLAHPFLGRLENGWSGVRENHPWVGRALTDMVIAQIYRGERGAPAYPKSISITGKWEEGVTTRSLHNKEL